jgi:hypothetical protein
MKENSPKNLSRQRLGGGANHHPVRGAAFAISGRQIKTRFTAPVAEKTYSAAAPVRYGTFACSCNPVWVEHALGPGRRVYPSPEAGDGIRHRKTREPSNRNATPLRLGLSVALSNQRLVNQIRKPLEQAVFVVREMLGEDQHHQFFGRIHDAQGCRFPTPAKRAQGS